MAKRFGKYWLYPLGLVVLGLFLTQGIQAQETALDRYVARPDPNYAFTEYRTQREIGYTVHFLRMTSQQWRSAAEVDRPIWEHEVIILIPRVSVDTTKTAVLLIDGGSNGGTPTTSVPQVLGAASIATGAVIAAVRQVPNQPLFFTDEASRGRKEDEILAYSLDKALVTGDLEWPVHLAMTKAAVRAMDTVQEFAARRGQEVRDFLVMGGSKRGWTTWLTAAVDPRVKAILPASIDMLNLSRQFVHHWEAYGEYSSPALDPYVEFDLPCRAQTPAGREVLRVVDPYAYRDRYAGLPKLVLNASGDQFFVTDSSRFYFAGLPGPKWLRYTPNTDHKLNEDAIVNAMSWIDDVLNNKASANIDWTVRGDGALRVTTSSRPKEVRLWHATNLDARDFRLEKLGAAWTSRVLTPEPDGAYVGFVPPPARGWTAFFVEVTFATAGLLKPDQVYTTDVLITPDVLPFAGTACDGQLEPPPARLESPEPGSFESGIGLIRGWVCDAGSVEIQINDGARQRVPYGSRRADTIKVCGHANTGFGYTVNWNNPGDGTHILRAFADGVEFAQAQFTVTTLGADFLRGVSGEYSLTNFPEAGRNVTVRWSQPHQNFVIAGANRNSASASVSTVPLAAGSRANLESPEPGSFESGIGLIRGWVCDARSVEIQINDLPRQPVPYGSRRADTIEVCGHANTGFGYTVNWNNLGDGVHTVRAFADDVKLAQAQFTVTTLGVDYLRGASGEYPLSNFPEAGRNITVRWSEPHQNFVIVNYR